MKPDSGQMPCGRYTPVKGLLAVSRVPDCGGVYGQGGLNVLFKSITCVHRYRYWGTLWLATG